MAAEIVLTSELTSPPLRIGDLTVLIVLAVTVVPTVLLAR
jgi:hypothetical protein